MTTTRIIDLAAQATALSTDYVAVDAAVGGTRKMLVSQIKPLQNKLSYYPARAPSGSDDVDAGYSVGSLWLWWQGNYAVGEGAWVCLSSDSTVASWTRLQPLNKTNGTAAPTGNEDANDGFSVGSLWLWPGHGTWVCTNADTSGSAAWTQLTQPLSDANPSAVGTEGPGTGTDVSRADHVHGQVTRDRTTAGNTTLVNTTDEILRVSAQADIQLPDPAGKRQFVVKKTGTGTYTINVLRYGAEKIEDVAANLELPASANTDQPAWMIYSDGTDWWIC